MEVAKFGTRDPHPKAWGREEWIVNNDMYCGKVLVFDSQEYDRTSLHFHIDKHETMLCISGSFMIITVDKTSADRVTHRLSPGDSIEIAPGTVHRIVSMQLGSVLIEFSTHHEDGDSYRIER